MSVLQFLAGFLGGKGPIDFDGGLIAVGLPGQGFLFELLRAANAAVEALAGKGGKLNFGHIEPGTVLGRVRAAGRGGRGAPQV